MIINKSLRRAYYQIAWWLNFVEKPLFALSHCILDCFVCVCVLKRKEPTRQSPITKKLTLKGLRGVILNPLRFFLDNSKTS